MPTITVQIIGDRLAIVNNGTPCLWVAGKRPDWAKYVARTGSMSTKNTPTKYSTWGISYAEACDLIKLLKESGVHANIASGGIAMYPENETQTSIMKAACAAYGTTAMEGNTLEKDRVLDPAKANAYINRQAKVHGVDMGLPEE
jgi:hypothetical protein